MFDELISRCLAYSQGVVFLYINTLLIAPASAQAPISPENGTLMSAGYQARLERQRSITFQELTESANKYYPALISARIDAQASTEDVVAAVRSRWPSVSTTIESNSGNLRTYPTKFFQIDQILWDFGRNTARISEAEASSDIATVNFYLRQQDLFLQMAVAWQSMLSARERLRMGKETLKRLQSYQAQMIRRVEAQASSRIDLELANSRVLQTEVELSSARSGLQIAILKLEQLSGKTQLEDQVDEVAPWSSMDASNFFKTIEQQGDWSQLANRHPSVAKARAELVQIEHRLKAKEAEKWPQIFARAYKPIGANFSNATAAGQDASVATFIGVRYAPGAGFVTSAEAQALATRVASTEQAVQTARLEVQQALQNDSEEYKSVFSRLASLEKTVAGANVVLESYQRQFQAGKKSWQDLLNAVRELAQSQYAQADAQAALVGAKYRLLIRAGQEPR